MAVIQKFSLNLKINEIQRRVGLGNCDTVIPKIQKVIVELLTKVEDEGLLKPVVAYEIFSSEDMDKKQFSMRNDNNMNSRLLTSLIPDAKEIAVSVCTIGPLIEEQVTNYFSNGDNLRAVLLDGIGSAAVDSLEIKARDIIAKEASSRGYQISSPINPGMQCLPLTEQRWLLELAHAEYIGVSLTKAFVMVPYKSASMVIGLGYEMQMLTPMEMCAKCNLNSTCHYKYAQE
jgi:cobalamin-dependent methionine synthase I